MPRHFRPQSADHSPHAVNSTNCHPAVWGTRPFCGRCVWAWRPSLAPVLARMQAPAQAQRRAQLARSAHPLEARWYRQVEPGALRLLQPLGWWERVGLAWPAILIWHWAWGLAGEGPSPARAQYPPQRRRPAQPGCRPVLAVRATQVPAQVQVLAPAQVQAPAQAQAQFLARSRSLFAWAEPGQTLWLRPTPKPTPVPVLALALALVSVPVQAPVPVSHAVQRAKDRGQRRHCLA